MSETSITVGLAQIAPMWLQRDATIDKVIAWIADAAARECDLVAFGEALEVIGIHAPAEVTAGNVLTTTLLWSARGIPDANYTAFLHLLQGRV